jgi:Ring finger domain
MGVIDFEAPSILDAVLLLVWMFLITAQRFVAFTSAVSTVRKQQAAMKLATRDDPRIDDVCQICSGDIVEFTNLGVQYDDDRDPAGPRPTSFWHPSSSRLDVMMADWAPRTTACGHIFHRCCIRLWVTNRSPNCPVCGYRLKMVKSQELHNS